MVVICTYLHYYLAGQTEAGDAVGGGVLASLRHARVAEGIHKIRHFLAVIAYRKATGNEAKSQIAGIERKVIDRGPIEALR